MEDDDDSRSKLMNCCSCSSLLFCGVLDLRIHVKLREIERKVAKSHASNILLRNSFVVFFLLRNLIGE